MPASLQTTTPVPTYTKDAILIALKSSSGQRTAWIVVEAEDDLKVYTKFMNSASTVVKTSEGEDGRRGYSNVESIVTEIKVESPLAHICGIRDADYTRYEKSPHACPQNVFVTDYRDLEMMLLAAPSVLKCLRKWSASFDVALALCIPVCRYLGCLRIYNMVKGFSCVFHNKLTTAKLWDFETQSLITDWKEKATSIFISLVDGACTKEDICLFIQEGSLEKEHYLNVCRGHDLLPLLSKTLINTQEYSTPKIMQRMTDAYSYEDFKQTHLYAQLKKWQEKEGVDALSA